MQGRCGRRRLDPDSAAAGQAASSSRQPTEGPRRPNTLIEGKRQVTSTVHDPVELFCDILEEQFHRHTGELSQLVACAQQPDRGGYDDETLIALIVSSRLALAHTADALRRMAEDTYGTCKRCAASIPLERLQILPHAQFCVSCQRVRDR